MNRILFSFLDKHLGEPLTAALAMDILRVSAIPDPLIDKKDISGIAPVEHEGFIFNVERIESIEDEMKPLHLSHWDETEAHRHDLPFNPDYATFIHYEQAGRYILFTLRKDGQLVGNCAMYLDKSTHTQTLMATEDTLYLLPEARKGNVAKTFVGYIENSLKSLGVKEIGITVKTVNKAGLFFQRMGYRHVENGLTKVLEN